VVNNREEAARLALDAANRIWGYPKDGEELVILLESTEESELAWAFTYNTRASVESGDIMLALPPGNRPIVVVKATGHVEPMSSLYSGKQALQMFETGRCDGIRKLTTADWVEIFRSANSGWLDYTPEEWAEYNRDPCGWCIKELRNPDASIRCNAADILRGLAWDAEDAIPALIEGFQDSSEDVRAACVFAIGDIGFAIKAGAAAAVPPLTELLRDSNPEIRCLAVAALEAIGPAAASAASELRLLLYDPDQEVRNRAAWALEALEGVP